MSSLKYFHILLLIYSHVAINCIIKWIFQRRRCCAFDSPGLPNDSAGYPGLAYSVWGTTPSVLRFFWLIRHESPRYNHAFSEKAQHLQRWISLQPFTQGRLVPRQPWAIKSTTPTVLHGCNIRNDSWIHWNIGKKQIPLCTKNLHFAKYIHWKTIFISTALTIDIIYIGE